MNTYAYGFPRLGKEREFKSAIENFWNQRLEEKELIGALDKVEEERLACYKQYVDNFPIGEFSYYDNIFDTALIFGVYTFKTLNDYFDYARGKKALELKKYFNTNYHYLVPHISKNKKFRVSWNKPLFYFNTFFSFADQPIFLIGPYTFLKLSRLEGNFAEHFMQLCYAYKKLMDTLYAKRAHYFHLEEPAFVLDIPRGEKKLLLKGYNEILKGKSKVNLITYYESVHFLRDLYELPCHSIGLDFVAGSDTISFLRKEGFPCDKNLICGVVDGKNVRRSDIFQKAGVIENIKKITKLPQEKIFISHSAPLIHLPVTLDNESSMPAELKSKMSFAKERLYELFLIKEVLSGRSAEAQEWCKNVKPVTSRTQGQRFDTLAHTRSELRERKKVHQTLLHLPLFPTTTIGSFPQDKDLRKIRMRYRQGNISGVEYDEYIKNKISDLIKLQETIGLDVLAHGEFERTDMVEFFAQKLDGFITTQKGWVTSYGTRVYRPPIIYGDIERNQPLTVNEISYAQTLTSKPVKGIFTGPITIIAWSYNLRDDALYKIAFELAKVLNKEAKELIKRHIRVIQIDEPAIKECAPLKKKKRNFYFSWAVRAFNIAARLPKSVQVHTHMCYSEFSDIIRWINQMNFDVITIEAARENAHIVDAFRKVRFSKQIGPGVWDIHSKFPAEKKIIAQVLDKSIKVFGKDNVWLNPDCGLKTRQWKEVETSLQRIVKVAKDYRGKVSKRK